MDITVLQDRDSIPKPRRAPTFPLTCSAHRCASSFCLISFARPSACFTAALALENTVPHQPPPELGARTASGTMDDAFSGSGSPSPLLAGVKLLWNDRELSPDLRKCTFSSLDRAPSVDVGVPVLVTLGDDFAVEPVWVRGVCGLLDGFGLSGIPSSSSRASGSRSPAPGFEPPLAVSSSTPMVSNWARSSSSVGRPFFDIAFDLDGNCVAIH